MTAYRNAMGGGELKSRLRHHSYLSLFNYNSIRIRIFIVGGIWSVISLSYFISANSQINPDRSIPFNIALAGVVEIIAYLISILTSLNLGRVYVIKRLLVAAGAIHICYYFIGPLNSYHGFSKVLVMAFDISVRITVSIGNTFLAIYVLELFPTSIRHFALGILGFITKLMYMLSTYFFDFWSYRHIHPNFVLGFLFIGSYFMCSKLRETHWNDIKDNLSEDDDGTMMCDMRADIV
jgi:OCT family organic cation transporter-like MFS transporter 4/5